MGLDFNAVGAKPEPHSCRSGESVSLTAAVGGGAFRVVLGLAGWRGHRAEQVDGSGRSPQRGSSRARGGLARVLAQHGSGEQMPRARHSLSAHLGCHRPRQDGHKSRSKARREEGQAPGVSLVRESWQAPLLGVR